jgi:hypothetical protein
MAIPPLVLRIYADSRGVRAGVMSAQRQVSGLRGAVQRNAGLIKFALLAGVVVGLKKSVDAASDLNEQINRNKEVFEGSAVGMLRWSKTTASAMGIAQSESLKAASNYGAMFDSAKLVESESAVMSRRLVGLASDMASFNDQEPTEMLERLQSGLAGMARPLRQFGVFISAARVEQEALRMGMERGANGYTDAQKILARYNIILQDTAKQQGDFNRTIGHSLPNQLRKLRAAWIDLSARLGKTVLPALVVVLKAINKITANLGIMIGAVAKAGVWFQKNFIEPTVKAWQDFISVIGKGVGIIKSGIIGAWRAVRGPVLAVIHAITWAVGGLIRAVQSAISWIAKLGSAEVPTINGRPATDIGGVRGQAFGRSSASVRPRSTNAPAGRVSVTIDRRRWAREADYEVAYGGA